MPEPTTSAGAAGVFGWKFIGGLAGVFAVGASLSTLVVVCMRMPRCKREWIVGLISTLLGSVAGGAGVVVYFNLLKPLLLLDGAELWVGMAALSGLIFLCGLPFWAGVRMVFNAIERRSERDLMENIHEIRRELAGVVQTPPPAPPQAADGDPTPQMWAALDAALKAKESAA